jgi:hypothetical protein
MAESKLAEQLARHGWESLFPEFRDTPPRVIRGKLEAFVADASPEQVRAWDASIPSLQGEVGEVLAADEYARRDTAILEYELPLESRRPDVVLLIRGAVVVLELKGKSAPTQADLDQVSAYARDLRNYHRHCASSPVHPVLVPMRARGDLGVMGTVRVVGPDALDDLIQRLQPDWRAGALSAREFLDPDAYCPLPSLVRAARELFRSGTLRRVHRARAATEPAIREISGIIHEAARTRTRRLILLTGVPGSGKTLVGLQIAHADFLDDLAEPRAGGKSSAPAVFLSGNGPLVEVLQYELRKAGGDGKAFVRGVKEYVKTYSRPATPIPPEHVLIFDEAQRAWDREQVANKHENHADKSEPELFVEFASRIPGWGVVLGLVGTGQEIHVGEEAGLSQWCDAVKSGSKSGGWIVHAPPAVCESFLKAGIAPHSSRALSLDTEIRYHQATDLHRLVELLLQAGDQSGDCKGIAGALEDSGYHLRLTRQLETAKQYLRDRYQDDPEARYGLVGSSKDRDLVRFGIPNDFFSTERVKRGPWFSDGAESPHSCRHLHAAVTEFQAQGLEMDSVLLGWGTDLVRSGAKWSNERARGYKRGTHVRDPFQLRRNAYRVLLTRGRDGSVVFVPPLSELDETYEYLAACGFKQM